MSRSYKKSPVVTDKDSAKEDKQKANRKYRRRTIEEDESGGKSKQYKKNYNQYDIHDYKSYETEEQAREGYRGLIAEGRTWMLKKYPTEEDYIKDNWEKYYHRK